MTRDERDKSNYSTSSVDTLESKKRLTSLVHARAASLAKDGIPEIKSYISKGRLYAYHRPTGTKILSPWGTPAFFRELLQLRKRPKKQVLLVIGTITHATEHFSKSEYFLSQPLRTRPKIRQAIAWLWKRFPDVQVEDIDQKKSRTILEAAKNYRGLQFANAVAAIMSVIWDKQQRSNPIYDNPFLLMENFLSTRRHDNNGQGSVDI